MATVVENLEKLERRMTITLPLDEVKAEVDRQLKIRARTARAPGFRPGKVPLKMVAAQYGFQIESDVLNEKLGRAFSEATLENNLPVAGQPRIEAKSGDTPEGVVVFDATFEVYPEVKIGSLEGVEVEQVSTEISDAEIEKTIDILRKQRVHYHVKGEQGEHGDGGADLSAQDSDRATVDFVGRIDGVEFPGGKADDFAFVLGEGRMLPEFEQALLGMKVGETRSFDLAFPEDYHGKDVAGKTAQFEITLKKLEWAHMPELDADFARSLGVANGDLDVMRADIRRNLEREVGSRVKAKTKESVMDALIKISELELPAALVEQDIDRLVDMASQDMAQRGMDPKGMQLPRELFKTQAERRVKLGLILSEIVKENALQANPEQVKTQVEEFAQAYEDPQQVIKYYFGDRNRLAEVEALVLEENVVNFVLGKSKVVDKQVAFDELMGNGQQG